MLHALFCRSDRHRTLFDPALPQNRQLLLAIASSLALQAGAHLVPGLRRLLGVTALGVGDLAVTVAGAVLPLLVNELGKPGRQSRAATSAAAQRSTSRLTIFSTRLSTSADAMPPPNLPLAPLAPSLPA